jgi:hypothetical protein
MTYLFFMVSVILVCKQTASDSRSTSGKSATDLLVGCVSDKGEKNTEIKMTTDES